MSRIQLSMHTTQEAIDWICTLLATINYTDVIKVNHWVESEAAAQIEGAFQAYVVNVYIPDGQYKRVEEIINLLSPLCRTGMITDIQVEEIEDKFSDETKINSGGHRVGQFLILSSSADDLIKDTNQIELRLNSSFAFGSGLHPATMLSLQLLERSVKPQMAALDLGCGSGILSVAMAKLGASVTAIDNDPIAIAATQAAVQQNGVMDQVTILVGSLGSGSDLGHWISGDLIVEKATLKPAAQFDLIVANILARIHLALVEDYQKALRRSTHGGLLITAGFTTDYESEINSTFANAGFEQVDRVQLNEWIAFAHQAE